MIMMGLKPWLAWIKSYTSTKLHHWLSKRNLPTKTNLQAVTALLTAVNHFNKKKGSTTICNKIHYKFYNNSLCIINHHSKAKLLETIIYPIIYDKTYWYSSDRSHGTWRKQNHRSMRIQKSLPAKVEYES